MLNLISVFFLLFAHGQTPPLEFAEAGNVFATEGLPQLEARTPTETMKVYEPQEGRAKTYVGFSLLPLLNSVFGSRMNNRDMVSFYCADGYRADVPLQEFQNMKALLAHSLADKSPFVLKGKSGPITLAPFYLVWNHPDVNTAKKEVYRWPYAVTQIEVIDSKEGYRLLQVSEPELQVGQKHFMKHCFSCHAVNGSGGRRGPPLNGFFQTQSEAELIRYILNPKSVKKNSQMAGLAPDLKDRQKVAKEIVRYVKKIAR